MQKKSGSAASGPTRSAFSKLCRRYHQQRRQQRRCEWRPCRQWRRQRTSWVSDSDLAMSPSALPLAGAESVDDVPAKPKPAASTNAIMIERIQSSLGWCGPRTARSVWVFS